MKIRNNTYAHMRAQKAINYKYTILLMTVVLTTCSVLLGKEKEFEGFFQKIKEMYENEGAETIGFWWTLGGEVNEAIWIMKWNTITSFRKAKKNVTESEGYPSEEITSLVASYHEKILEE